MGWREWLKIGEAAEAGREAAALGLRLSREGRYLRVAGSGGHVVVYRYLPPARFLRQYRELLSRVRLNFEPLPWAGVALAFTDGEQQAIREELVLGWMMSFDGSGRSLAGTTWNPDEPLVRAAVLRRARARLGGGGDAAAIALTAHTLGLDAERLAVTVRVEEDRASLM